MQQEIGIGKCAKLGQKGNTNENSNKNKRKAFEI